MFRVNAQSRALEESFLRYGIRYQLVGGTRFYARREIKDALAYLRVLRSDLDAVSFERIINVPARGIGDRTIELIRAEARRAGSTWAGIERSSRHRARRGPRSYRQRPRRALPWTRPRGGA
jgi:DNA helicase-2/ATP-dependent DNA helicase PcrA